MHPCMAQAREALKAALKEKSGALAVALEARDAARAKAAVLEENAEHARDEASALAQALSAAEVWSNRSRLLPCFETRQHSLPTPSRGPDQHSCPLQAYWSQPCLLCCFSSLINTVNGGCAAVSQLDKQHAGGGRARTAKRRLARRSL